MRRIAITGNIGSGKTTVCDIFRALGIPVFYADSAAKSLYKRDEILEQIRINFGTEVFDQHNQLDFGRFAQLIFNDKEALKSIGRLIHPYVFDIYHTWLAAHRDAPYTIFESAIVFENQLSHHFDLVIQVASPDALRIERVMARDKVDIAFVEQRMRNQLGEDEKAKLANVLIVNDGKQLLIPQVIRFHHSMLKSQ